MIFGTGIDIVEVERIRKICKRWRKRFLNRVLREEEIKYCLSQNDPAQCIAARFAGKEAVSKAFGTGIGAQLGWHDIEIVHQPKGRPTVKLHGRGKILLLDLNGPKGCDRASRLLCAHRGALPLNNHLLDGIESTPLKLGILRCAR